MKRRMTLFSEEKKQRLSGRPSKRDKGKPKPAMERSTDARAAQDCSL